MIKCGGLFGCGRGLIMVGLMVVFVRAVHGAGGGKEIAAGVAGLLASFSQKGQNGSTPEERLDIDDFDPNDQFPCYYIIEKEKLLKTTQTAGWQAKAPFSRKNWEKVIDECCKTTSDQTCIIQDAIDKLKANGGPPGKGPLTSGIIILIALIPVIAYLNP